MVERVYGDSLDNLADTHFFKPLDMNRTTFYPEKFDLSEIVPTQDTERGFIHGVVHDESAWVFKTKSNRIMGHAGIFSTVPDILNFMEMLLNDGCVNNKIYFSKEIVREMYTNQISELNDYNGLGWELHQPRYMGKYASQNTFGKTGFTGCLCICDISKEIAYVILSNRIYPHRPKDSKTINQFRASIGEVFLSDGFKV